MYETLRDLLQREPFKPLQVRLTNGKSVPIRDPKTVMMSGGRVVVCFPHADRFDFFDAPDIAAIDLLKRAQRKK